MNNSIWIDTRLNEEEMNFLNDAVSEEKENWNNDPAKTISQYGAERAVIDKDNWFYETVIKELTEKMFYRDWDNYYKYHIVKEEPPPEFEWKGLWVNYMKQHEITPIHDHVGLYSFVVFMKIPTFWEEQHALPTTTICQGKSEVVHQILHFF